MNTEKHQSRWSRLQSGQAMMEYWPTIPVGIAIMIAAGMIAQMLNGAFLTTADALNRAGMGTEVCNTTAETDDGSDVTVMNDHTIQSCANVYDPETDTTTFCYTVTTGCEPSISHWVLGIPEGVAAKIVDSSEKYQAWGFDPKTGIEGVKFDTGYECDESSAAVPMTQPWLLSRLDSRPVMETVLDPTASTRDIFMVLAGQYEFGPVPVTVKAGTEVYTSTISAPVAPVVEKPADPTDPTDPTDLLEADNLHEGCAE